MNYDCEIDRECFSLDMTHHQIAYRRTGSKVSVWVQAGRTALSKKNLNTVNGNLLLAYLLTALTAIY